MKGIENVEEIAAVPGIHGLMFGPGDYMISAGLPLQLGGEPHPTFVAAMTKLVNAAKTNGLALLGYVFPLSRLTYPQMRLGIQYERRLTSSSAAQVPDLVPMLVQQGYAVIAVAFDYWGLAGMVKESLDKGRGYVKKAAGVDTP